MTDIDRPSASSTRPVASSTRDDIESSGYYGAPIVKPHVWKDVIGWYFFTGGLAGASSVLAAIAEVTGRRQLATHARRAALIGLLPSPALLIVDLGRPGRFANMLRVLKPSSPMSVGSWLLAAYGGCAATAGALGEIGRMPKLRSVSTVASGVIGPAIATYTGVLVADTATPVWHEARRELPWLFASSAAGSAGAVVTLLGCLCGAPDRSAIRLGAGGAVAAGVVATVMQHRLGDLDTYRTDRSARAFDRSAKALLGAGAALTVIGRRRRLAAGLGAAAICVGSVCERLSVLRAGTASAKDPRSVLRQQHGLARATLRPGVPATVA